MVYNFLDKKTSGETGKNENICNKELAEELHKPVINKFKKRRLQTPFIDNIWGADLADVHLISKIKEFVFYYVLLIFSKNAWVISLKDKKWYYNY